MSFRRNDNFQIRNEDHIGRDVVLENQEIRGHKSLFLTPGVAKIIARNSITSYRVVERVPEVVRVPGGNFLPASASAREARSRLLVDPEKTIHWKKRFKVLSINQSKNHYSLK